MILRYIIDTIKYFFYIGILLIQDIDIYIYCLYKYYALEQKFRTNLD